MKTNKLFLIVALLGTVLAGCQKVEEQIVEQKPDATPKGWTLTIKATKSMDTKAMEVASSTSLNAYWAKGEKVAVYFGGNLIGTLEVTSDDGVSPATLSGPVSVTDEGLSVNSKLMLLFPGREDNQWTYLGQNGALPVAFDYATSEITVTNLDKDNQIIETSTSEVAFQNWQSIYRFSFKKGGALFTPQSITVSSATNKLVTKRTWNGSSWESQHGPLTLSNPTETVSWMSILNENNSTENYYFSVIDSESAVYEAVKEIPAVALSGNGKFISVQNISVSPKALAPEASGSISTVSEVL